MNSRVFTPSPPAPTDQNLLREQLQLLFESAPQGIANAAVAGAMVVLLLSDIDSVWSWATWLGALYAVLGLRLWGYFKWRREQETQAYRRVAKLARTSFAMSGIVWGALPVVFFNLEPYTHQVFIILALLGISAGAVSSVSVLPYAAECYVLPMIIPLSIRLFIDDSAISIATGIATLLLSAFLLNNARAYLRLSSNNIKARHISDQLVNDAKAGERRYRAMIEHAADAVYLHNRDGKILDVNSMALTSLGYARDELLALTIFDIDKTSDRQILLNMWRDIQPGTRTVAASCHCRKDGSEFPVEVVVGVVDQGGEGQILALVRDVSDRQRNERELIESRTKLEDAQKIGKIGNWEWDIDKARIEWSAEIYRILGLDQNRVEPTQDAFAHAMYPDDLKLMEESFARGLAGEVAFNEEWRMVEANTGKIKTVQLRGERLFNADGTLKGMKGTLQDITERKQAEQAKSDFISIVSHELRTPLTSIYGALRLLLNGNGMQDETQSREMLKIALRNAEQLTALVNDILDFSRIEQGRFLIETQESDLVLVLRQALSLNEGYGRHYGVEYRAILPEESIVANIDAARITQVISNLMSNAVKYSPPRSVVDIRMATLGDRVRIEVMDQGPGIQEAFLPSLFSRFARADSSATRSKGGTGLGLSITKAIVEAHGGHIGYLPRAGGGSIFYFELPL